MTTASTSLAVTAGPRWNAGQAFKAQGEFIQFPTMTEANAAIAATPIWYTGQLVRVISDPLGVFRRWNGTNLREVVFGNGATATLSNDTDTAPAAAPATTATYGATTTVPAAAGWATVAATGDTTLTISGTPAEGQALTVAVRATGGASRTVTLPGASFVIPSSSTVTSPVTVAANTETLFAFRWSASAAKWRLVSLVAGY